MSDFKKLNFHNEKEALDNLNAQDMGRYYLCDCPSCQHHEAFIYKRKNILNCNRENTCGDRFILKFKSKEKNLKEYSTSFAKKDSAVPKKLTMQQIKERKWATRFLQFVRKNTKNELDGFRGISEENWQNFMANLHNEKLVQYFFQQTRSLFKKDYTTMDFITKRNLIMPILGEDGLVDRVLMRTTLDKNLRQKEVQLVLNPNAKNDFFVDVHPENEYVCVTEGPIDGFSYREVMPNMGVIAQSGSRKVNSIQNYIRNHKNQFIDKIFLLSFDQDRAGRIARYKWVDFLKEEGLSFTEMTGFPKGVNDPNDWLQQDAEGFKRSLRSVIHLYDSKFLLNSQKMLLERVHPPKDQHDENDWYRIYSNELVIGNVKVNRKTKEVTPPCGIDDGEVQIHFSPYLKKAIANKVSDDLPYYQTCPFRIPFKDSRTIIDHKVYHIEKMYNNEKKITFQMNHIIFKNVPFMETSKGENILFFQNAWLSSKAEDKLFSHLKELQNSKVRHVEVKDKSNNKKTTEFVRM